MGWTADDLVILETAIRRGARKVKYGDKETEYHSLDEMMRLRSQMQDEINGTTSVADRRTTGVYRTPKYNNC